MEALLHHHLNSITYICFNVHSNEEHVKKHVAKPLTLNLTPNIQNKTVPLFDLQLLTS